MGTSECSICEHNEYLDEYILEGKTLRVCRHCVDAALIVYARTYGVIQ